MADNKRVVILGGHGKVGLLAAAKLNAAGHAVDSVIRDPGQADDVEQAGGRPVELDIQSASVDDLIGLFTGAEAIVFTAGAGGKGPAERTRAVDHDAAVRTMQAAERSGVQRYVMVSYAHALDQYRELGPEHSFYPYAKAKHDADAHLRETALDYTILGPGLLTLESATGKLQLADEHGKVDGDWPDDKNVTSRENVAAVITHVIAAHAAVRQTVNFYDGDVAISDALAPGSRVSA
ncbi:MAG TPA: NAD(P)H-binding protein [Oleiagrimonas sp.]|nr:NAD(P)H-binding protein [Oleiagrimonas sp.]